MSNFWWTLLLILVCYICLTTLLVLTCQMRTKVVHKDTVVNTIVRINNTLLDNYNSRHQGSDQCPSMYKNRETLKMPMNPKNKHCGDIHINMDDTNTIKCAGFKLYQMIKKLANSFDDISGYFFLRTLDLFDVKYQLECRNCDTCLEFEPQICVRQLVCLNNTQLKIWKL